MLSPEGMPKNARSLILAPIVRALDIFACRQLELRSYGQHESEIRFLLCKENRFILYA